MKSVPIEEVLSRISVDPVTGCHEWTGYINWQGYGQVTFRGKVRKAHRFFYEHYKGPIVDGNYICHMCHNKKCVNPDHLYQGTQSDNMADMVEAGRQSRGEALSRTKRGSLNGSAKLSLEAIERMRELRRQGRSYQSIGDDFKVTIATAWRAINGHSWKPNHIDLS